MSFALPLVDIQQLPEGRTWRDNGCYISPKRGCLGCPRPTCILDDQPDFVPDDPVSQDLVRLGRIGPDVVTIITKRHGVSVATVYRRWRQLPHE